MVRFKFLPLKKGFTLVEALSASVVLAIGLFAVGLALSSEFVYIYQSREKAIATLSAQEEIENIRGMPFDTILGLGSSFTCAGFEYLHDPIGELEVDSSYGPDIKKISVSVHWTSFDGRALKTVLATLMSRNGINRQ